MKHLIVASGTVLTAEETRIQKFAHWMGVATKTARLAHGSARMDGLLAESDGPRCSVAISAETLAQMYKASSRGLEKFIHEHCAQLFVFGFWNIERHERLLRWVTGGAVRGVGVTPNSQKLQNRFDLPRSGREYSRQLAGLGFYTPRAVAVPTFDRAIDAVAAEALLLANGNPVFIRIAGAPCELFLLAGSSVPDIDGPIAPEIGLESYYSQLIPLLLFLRYTFGKACWHGPQCTARLIIDDPLLAQRYGCLDYRSLLTSMRRREYGTSIAFIPWNYRRTSIHTASSLFLQHPELSICVHGCDHTNKEFAVADKGLLERKAKLALERMERHECRTGLPFERVMVFPQGWFSGDAMLALRGANYLAAVNSTWFPMDEATAPLKVADFLRPAMMRFHGFPLFQRRYPRCRFDCAFDMFLGKPALLVEHHDYFRDGCESLEEFVAGLRHIEPTLTWPTLSFQLTRSCIMRVISHDTVEVQFFTRRFRLENTEEDRRRFRLAKYEPEPRAIRAVLVDGINVPFSFNDAFIEVELEIDRGQARDIEILDQPRPPQSARRMGFLYNAGVFARRSLSEFRDNTLATPGLLQIATGLARGLKLTGDRNGRPLLGDGGDRAKS